MDNTTNSIYKKELSLPISLIIVAAWVLILIGIMFNTIKKYTNYDENTYVTSCNVNQNC